MNFSKTDVVHFIGIGGSGMSAIARVLLEMGMTVKGSDIRENASTLRLKDLGAKVFFRHDASNLDGADVVVISGAIPDDNPELKRARDDAFTIVKRAEMLNFLMTQFSERVAIAGTHGKTTTTGMLSRVLTSMDKKPTYLIGGELTDYGGNAVFGGSDLCVAEADESDGSFLLLDANVGILTNVEAEHLEHYGDIDRLWSAFEEFMTSVLRRDGFLVVNRDSVCLTDITSGMDSEKIIYYSIDQPSEVMAKDIEFVSGGVSYKLWHEDHDCGEVRLRVFGRHNVYNSLAVLAYGLRQGLSLDEMKKALTDFSGTKRRFQHIGHAMDMDIYDDYGHHPTEIQTTLEGAKRSFNRRLVCIFQPHRYSRTRDLLEGFPMAFDSADMVIITEIYSAHERKIEGISGELIVDRMPENLRNRTTFVPNKSDIASQLLPKLRPDDVVITMGAGDIHTVAKELFAQLTIKEQSDPRATGQKEGHASTE